MAGLGACGMSAEKRCNQTADVKHGKYGEAIAAFEARNDYEESGIHRLAHCQQAGDAAIMSLIIQRGLWIHGCLK